MAHEPDPLLFDLGRAEIEAECEWEHARWVSAGIGVGERGCEAHHITTRLDMEGCVGELEGWLDCNSRVSNRRAWIRAMTGAESCVVAFNRELVYGEPDLCFGE